MSLRNRSTPSLGSRNIWARVAIACAGLALFLAAPQPSEARDRLTEPFLQDPLADGVSVVWFTETRGSGHAVLVGPERRRVEAETQEIRGFYEDADSHLPGQAGDGAIYSEIRERVVFRHEARVSGLSNGRRTPYRVVDVSLDGVARESEIYLLAPEPAPGAPLRILLTSDHQAKPMSGANIAKVYEVEPQIDAVFFAGDLVDHPSRASEWFDDGRGLSFFDVLQGRATYGLERETDAGVARIVYPGAPLLQNAPIFPALGNHEVSGQLDLTASIRQRFNSPRPRDVAEREYLMSADLINPTGDLAVRRRWIEDASFNTRAYREIFTLPADSPGGEEYYFRRFGDVALVSLFATRIWRMPTTGQNIRGRFLERPADIPRPDRWGHGAFIFEPISKGSTQYEWLVRTLKRPEFVEAPIKIVMLHHGPRGFGGNVTPPFTPPQREIFTDASGAPSIVRYRYPKDQDVLIRDVEPLLIEADVDLIFFGHSHIWQRMRLPNGGPHLLESSNVGNNYGCYYGGRTRWGPAFDLENHTPEGDPYGLEPIMPRYFAPMATGDGAPLPCVASNTLTTFSILDTAQKRVDSYVFDTEDPTRPPQLFDRFDLN